jgi:hypothetical protein
MATVAACTTPAPLAAKRTDSGDPENPRQLTVPLDNVVRDLKLSKGWRPAFVDHFKVPLLGRSRSQRRLAGQGGMSAAAYATEAARRRHGLKRAGPTSHPRSRT